MEEEFDLWTRMALATIINYDIGQRHRRKGKLDLAAPDLAVKIKLNELVDELPGERDLSDKVRESRIRKRAGEMLQNAAHGTGTKGLTKLKEYYSTAIDDPKQYHFQEAPPHIRAAFEEVYGDKNARSDVSSESTVLATSTSAVRPDNEYSTRRVFSMIRHENLADREALGRNYAGIWDIIRYSAQTSRDAAKNDPTVVRAAVQIGPMDINNGRNDPWFLLHYKPHDFKMPRISTGSVILLNKGQHFCFFGHEHDTDAPLYIVGKVVNNPDLYFSALVVRRHTDGFVFASRATFVRSKATSLEQLEKKIGVRSETSLKEEFSDDIRELDECLRMAVNYVPNDGKHVLKL
jgi:hypothetical protein